MLRTVVAWTLFPALLMGSVGFTLAAIREGYSPTAVVMGTIFASAVPLLVAQALMPHRETWRGTRTDWGIDLLHMASTGITTEGWRALTLGAFYAGAVALSAALGTTAWPETWPILAQLALALVIGDFGAYWVHRMCHRHPLLWRVHAMHHSSERLYVFASARNHPMNAILAYGSQLLPLTVLGAPTEIIALISVFTGVHGMLQHCNVDLRHGLLNWVFSTADLHRWHHSTDFDESNTNFGNNLLLWDIVFGTRDLPAITGPRAVGLSDVAFPDNFLAHLASPFMLHRWVIPVLKTLAPAQQRVVVPDAPSRTESAA